MSPPRGSLRIGVVDQDPGVRRLLELALRYWGHRVEGCEQPTDVIEKVRSGTFDLLMIELQKGIPGGLEVLTRLHSSGLRIPAILLSSRFPERILRGRGVPANVSLLLKPFSLDHLERSIEEHRLYQGIPPLQSRH